MIRRFSRVCLALAFLLLPGAPGWTQETPFTVVPLRLGRAPVIDGLIEKEEWQDAALIDSFTQLDPHEGAPVSEPTEVRVGYDTHNLYFAIRGGDSDPSGVVAKVLTRDAELTYDDTIEVILDTFLDGRSAFLFATNPLGVQVDGLVRSEGEQINYDWDGLWSCAARRDDGGFTVEMAIPFRTLRFNPGPSQVWGFNVTRLIARKRELALWTPASHLDGYNARYKISRYGRLSGRRLGDLQRTGGIALEIDPHGDHVQRPALRPRRAPLRRGRDRGRDGRQADRDLAR